MIGVAVAEVGYGIARLPPRRRRQELAAAAEEVFASAEKVLPFDAAAAAAHGDVVTTRERAGTPISALDAQIAVVARARGAALATRNTGDSTGLDLDLFKSWTSPPQAPSRRRSRPTAARTTLGNSPTHQ